MARPIDLEIPAFVIDIDTVPSVHHVERTPDARLDLRPHDLSGRDREQKSAGRTRVEPSVEHALRRRVVAASHAYEGIGFRGHGCLRSSQVRSGPGRPSRLTLQGYIVYRMTK